MVQKYGTHDEFMKCIPVFYAEFQGFRVVRLFEGSAQGSLLIVMKPMLL